MEAIVIAAGQGTRLAETTGEMPKSLLPFDGGTVLSTIFSNLMRAGVDRVRLVVGCRKERIEAYVRDLPRIALYENPRWEGGNGLSVLAALPDGVPAGGILLSMSDHIVSARALAALVAGAGESSRLLVDRRIEAIFDIDDATKLRVDGRRIVAIGKELAEFNAVDCGIFGVTETMRSALESNARAGRESITDAVRTLIGADAIEAVEIPADCAWIDIDTPAAYAHARQAPERYR
jgi:choline kinase